METLTPESSAYLRVDHAIGAVLQAHRADITMGRSWAIQHALAKAIAPLVLEQSPAGLAARPGYAGTQHI